MAKQATFQFKPFSPRQKKILTWWIPHAPTADYDGIIADGAIRAGKTLPMSLGFVIWAMAAFDSENFGMCGKTIGAFRRNVLSQLKRMLYSQGYTVTDNRQDNLVTIRKNGRENYFYVFGGRDERSQDLIQGITLAGVYFDEVALMPESFVNQAVARCSVEGSRYWFNCNPAGPKHWFRTEWILKCKEKRLLYLHFTMDDNYSLAERIKERYRAMFTGVFYKRYILGLWALAEGLVYQQFADDPDAFVIDEEPPIHYAVIGVDFGGSKSAHAFTLTGFTPRYKEVVVLDEFYHNNIKDGKLTPAQVEAEFVKFAMQAKARFKVYETRCDSAEQTLITGLQVAAASAHLGISVVNAVKGPINDRIAFYNSIMAQGRFRIMRRCKHTIDALEEAVYDDTKPVKDERLDDGTTNIDSLDAMEYSTEPLHDQIMYLNFRRQ